MKNDEILHKWINNTISEEELKQFKLRPEYHSLVELYKNSEHLEAPKIDESQMLKEILMGDDKKSISPNPSKKRSLFPILAIAATAAMLIGIFLFWNNSQQTINIASQFEKKEGLLPGQSNYVLNAKSSISYNKKTWHKNRDLKLQGEAFFDVKKGSTFRVQTTLGMIEVLGTEFNVKSRANSFEVTCLEGQVLVTLKQGNLKRKLSINEGIRLSSTGEFDNIDNFVQHSNSWMNGITKLNNVSISTVIKELKHHYDVQIQSEGIDLEKRLTCNFPHDNINLALQSCFDALQIKYDIDNARSIKLYSK